VTPTKTAVVSNKLKVSSSLRYVECSFKQKAKQWDKQQAFSIVILLSRYSDSTWRQITTTYQHGHFQRQSLDKPDKPPSRS